VAGNEIQSSRCAFQILRILETPDIVEMPQNNAIH